MLLKHNLSVLDMDSERKYIHKQIGTIGRKNPAKSIAAMIITRFFFVEGLWTQSYDSASNTSGTILEIYGTPENVQMAEYVYSYLLNSSGMLWFKHKDNQKIRGNRHRRTFVNAVLHGFYKKLDSDSKSNSSTGGLPVWTGDPLLSQYYRKRNPIVRKSRTQFSRSSKEIYDAGQTAGNNLVINKGIKSSSGPGGRFLKG